MFEHGYGMGFGGGFMWLFWILIIVVVVLLIRSVTVRTPSEATDHALEILKERYARGEIEQEEYERKRRELME